MHGHRCPRCSFESSALIRKMKYGEFLKKAILVHGERYIYNEFNPINNKDKIAITCRIHGEFKQSINSHLKGNGCKECSRKDKGFNYSNWKRAGDNSKYFESFKVYIIKCTGHGETFYKIGKTYTSIKSRYRVVESNKMPYKYEIEHVFIGDAIDMCKLEHYLHCHNYKNRYRPKISFAGERECFTTYDINLNERHNSDIQPQQ
jgi:hypothetical protein